MCDEVNSCFLNFESIVGDAAIMCKKNVKPINGNVSEDLYSHENQLPWYTEE